MTTAELEEVVLKELDKLYRVARRMTSSPTESEDLVGITLLTAFKQCHRCDGQYPFAWLVKIMRNKHLHNVRDAKLTESGDAELEHIVDGDAHRSFMAAIGQIDILAALDKLPEEYRMAVALCDMEELDYSEAAEALDVPVGTIRSRLNRGRKMLQRSLSAWSSIP